MSFIATIIDNIFDTYSRQIIIYKQPIEQQVSPQPQGALFGFGQIQQNQLYTYTPVTGVFQAIIRYSDRYASTEKDNELQSEVDEYITEGPVSIKVQQNCKDFIINGVTDKIKIDGETYILDGVDPKAKFLFGSQYFIFDLERKR